MKILELTNFSAGACGVFARAFQESLELKKKGHEIIILSSNLIKGTNQTASEKEIKNKIEIRRFPYKKLGGESYMSWLGENAEKIILDFKPDVIIAHSYRHLHTTKALKIRDKLKNQGFNCRIFLVTHAPFERKRSTIQSLFVFLYDNFIGKKTINRFDKIILITSWEKPYLEKLNADKEKLIYIPNGIPKEFFTQKPLKEKAKILFLGRISPIKDIETLIKSINFIKNKKIIIEIVGPHENEYFNKLKQLVDKENLKERVIFSEPIYDLKQKISKIDEASIFVLPSKSEGMPQSLVEAMARKKLVIASDNPGNSDLINNLINGFLFEVGNQKQLAEKIDFALDKNNAGELNKIKLNAIKTAREFSWEKLSKTLEKAVFGQ